MNITPGMGDALWSIVLTTGLARVASALAGWPRTISDDAAIRAVATDRLLRHLNRGVLGGAFVALALAGLFRNRSIVVQLPLWVAFAAMAWSVFAVYGAVRPSDAPYRMRLHRVSQCASAAIWASAIAAIAIIGRLILSWRPNVWLVVAGALLYLGVRVYALLKQAAEDVQALNS